MGKKYQARGMYIDESLELTEIERYQLRIKALEERNQYLEMARVLEKKLLEFLAIKEVNQAYGWPIYQLCQIRHVSKSGYYKC